MEGVKTLSLGGDRFYVFPEPRAARLGELSAEGYECRILRKTLASMADSSLAVTDGMLDSIALKSAQYQQEARAAKDSLRKVALSVYLLENERDYLHEGWKSSKKQSEKFSKQAKRRGRAIGPLAILAFAAGVFMGSR